VIPTSEISHVGKYNHQVERFKMRLRGTNEIWEVSINHTRKAVKISNVVLPLDKWHLISSMSPENARRTIKTAIALDGEILAEAELI